MPNLMRIHGISVVIFVLERDAINLDVGGPDRLPLVESYGGTDHFEVHVHRLKRFLKLGNASVRGQDLAFKPLPGGFSDVGFLEVF